MTSGFSVIVGTYGDDRWKVRAEQALASAHDQTFPAVDVIHVHGDTLADARNTGALRANGEYLIFLDADDELDCNYLASMNHARFEAAGVLSHPTWLFQPSTLGLVDGREDPEAVLIPERPLHTGNFMVIGTAVQRQLFLDVGGFKDWPMYEDWCLWIRCWQKEAGFWKVPDAIYRVHVFEGSRNQGIRAEQVRYFNEIRKMYFH